MLMATANLLTTCDSGRCGFCTRGSLDLNPTFSSNCTDDKFHISYDAPKVTCQAKCCIYLISCKICCMKYVGKTVNTIRDRLNGHRGAMRGRTEAEVMLNHFAGEKGHGIGNMIMKPIEGCANKSELDSKEKYWMKELNTVFPYGLNMDIKSKGIKNAYKYVINNTSDKSIYSTFAIKPSKRTSRGKGRRSIQTTTSNPTDLQLNSFDAKVYVNRILENNKSNYIHYIRTELFKLKSPNLKEVFLYVINIINEEGTVGCDAHQYVMYMIKDLCLHKLRKLFLDKPKNMTFVVFKFKNKILDRVKFNKIFTQCSDIFPRSTHPRATPSVSFQSNKSIRGDILNYNQTILNAKNTVYSCKCNTYSPVYTDSHHKHIVTGDLGIIKNGELRGLISKGLNFHEQQPPNKEVAYNAIKSGVDSYIRKSSELLNIPLVQFSHWKAEVLKAAKQEIDKFKPYKYNKVLSKAAVQRDLSKLHDDFVLVPVDKAANNVALVCKAFYMEVLTKEITDSDTFCNMNSVPNDILDSINTSGYIKSSDRQALPKLYCTVKCTKALKHFVL